MATAVVLRDPRCKSIDDCFADGETAHTPESYRKLSASSDFLNHPPEQDYSHSPCCDLVPKLYPDLRDEKVSCSEINMSGIDNGLPGPFSETAVNKILAEITAFIPGITPSHLRTLRKTLENLNIKSRSDMSQIEPVDLVNALGTEKAKQVAGIYNCASLSALDLTYILLANANRFYGSVHAVTAQTYCTVAVEISKILEEQEKESRESSEFIKQKIDESIANLNEICESAEIKSNDKLLRVKRHHEMFLRAMENAHCTVDGRTAEAAAVQRETNADPNQKDSGRLKNVFQMLLSFFISIWNLFCCKKESADVANQKDDEMNTGSSHKDGPTAEADDEPSGPHLEDDDTRSMSEQLINHCA